MVHVQTIWRVIYPYPRICLSACWSLSCLLDLRFLKGSGESSYKPLRTDPGVHLLCFWKALSSWPSCSGKEGVWARCYGDAHCGRHTHKNDQRLQTYLSVWWLQHSLFKTVLSVSKLSLCLAAQTWFKLERHSEFHGRAGRDKAGFPQSLSPLPWLSSVLLACEIPSMILKSSFCSYSVGSAMVMACAYYQFHLWLTRSYYTHCVALTFLPGTVIHCFQYSNGIAWVCHHQLDF